jgi:hypothetical protein
MAHERLQRSRIDSTSRQGVSGSMAQHVSMDRKWQLRLLFAIRQIVFAQRGLNDGQHMLGQLVTRRDPLNQARYLHDVRPSLGG